MSNASSLSEETSSPSAVSGVHLPPSAPMLQEIKRKRGRNSDPDAEVVALSEEELLSTHRFKCEVCDKGFQRDQNLQLHRRGHNLPWKLKKDRDTIEAVRKKVYVCPVPTCVHHMPERALGDITGIKKHYSRKHGEKKWKCERCSKAYAVESDCKAHMKICGSREYICNCGTIFSRRDSFMNHRVFCRALAEESERMMIANQAVAVPPPPPFNPPSPPSLLLHFLCPSGSQNPNPLSSLHFPDQNPDNFPNPSLYSLQNLPLHPFSSPPPSANLTATGQQLQEAAIFGSKPMAQFSEQPSHDMDLMDKSYRDLGALCTQKDEVPTRDFLGLSEDHGGRRTNNLSCENNQNGDAAQVSMNMKDLLSHTSGHMEPGSPSYGEGGEFMAPSASLTGCGVADDQSAAAKKRGDTI